MSDKTRIARLADLHEFAELKHHFDERREEEVQALARKTYANPEAHDRLEWEKTRAFYAGVEAVFGYPIKARAALKRDAEKA